MDFDDSIFRGDGLSAGPTGASAAYRSTTAAQRDGYSAAPRSSSSAYGRRVTTAGGVDLDSLTSSLPRTHASASRTNRGGSYQDPLLNVRAPSYGSDASPMSAYYPSVGRSSAARYSASSVSPPGGATDDFASPTAPGMETPPRPSASARRAHSTPPSMRAAGVHAASPAAAGGATPGVEEIERESSGHHQSGGGAGAHSRSPVPKRASANPTAAVEARSPQVKRFMTAMHRATVSDSPIRPGSAGLAAPSSDPFAMAGNDSHIMRRRFRVVVESLGALSSSTGHGGGATHRQSDDAALGLPAAAASGVTCEIARDLAAPRAELLGDNNTDVDDDDATTPAGRAKSIGFSCADEVSSLVNIGDAAHCRVIDLRAAFASERAAQKAMCDATTSMVVAIDDELDAVPPQDMFGRATAAASLRRDFTFADRDDVADGPSTPVDQTFSGVAPDGAAVLQAEFAAAGDADAATSSGSTNDGDEAERHGDEDQESLDSLDAYDLSKLLIPHCDAASREQLSGVVAAVSNCSAAGVRHVESVLRALVQEASGKAVDPHFRDFDADSRWHAAQDLGQREAEAKSGGNLALCAQLRRELIALLADALHDGLACTEQAQSPFTELSPARRGTTMCLRTATSDTRRHVEHVQAVLEGTQMEATAAAAELARVADQQAKRRDAALSFLTENDREIQATLAEIDQLYGRLEVAVHARNNKVKHFVKQRAAIAVESAAARATVATIDDSLQELQARHHASKASDDALAMCGTLVGGVRAHVEAKNRELLEHMSSQREGASGHCAELYAELSTCVTGWVDVLVKNASRERDRESNLRASIEDATERYHQSDLDLYTSQLHETEQRRKLTDAEVTACEEILKKATARMHAAGIHTGFAPRHSSAMFGATPSRPETATTTATHLNSRPATPMRTAAPRFSHQHPFASPSPARPTTSYGAGGVTPGTGPALHFGNSASRPPRSQNGPPSPPPPMHFDATSTALVIHGSQPPTPQRGHSLVLNINDDEPRPRRATAVPDASFSAHTAQAAASHVSASTPSASERDMAAFFDAVEHMPVRDMVNLFTRKSAATRDRWAAQLEGLDIETGGELRGMRLTADVWSSFLTDAPLLKSLLEQLLDAPDRFLEIDDDDDACEEEAAASHIQQHQQQRAVALTSADTMPGFA